MLRSHINATTLQQHLMKKLDYIKWDKLRNNNFLSISVSVQSFVFNVSQITFTNRWFCIDPMPNLKTCQVKVFRCILQLAAQLFIDTSWIFVSYQIFVWCGKDWYFISILNWKCLRSIVRMICTGLCLYWVIQIQWHQIDVNRLG